MVPGLSGYLLLMAELAERQAEIFQSPPLLDQREGLALVRLFQRGGWDGRSLAASAPFIPVPAREVTCERSGHAPGGAEGCGVEEEDRRAARALISQLNTLTQSLVVDVPAVMRALAHIEAASLGDVHRWLASLWSGEFHPGDSAILPFVAAALQIELARWAAGLNPGNLGRSAEPGRCPVCGGWPVASVLRTAGEASGLRYLHCGFCASEWQFPRIQCIQCGSGEHIAYHGIDGADPAVQAETCDACHIYLKRIDRDKSPDADPLADDLATLAMDVLLNEQGDQRFGFNPLMIIPATT